MPDSSLYPRYAESRLLEALDDSPVVLIHGPRQCGKTTLARKVGESLGYSYLNLDDDAVHTAATDDPTGFVRSLPERVILDEVQRAPGLFRAVKTAVDRDRRSGRFLLTGSANVLALPKISESLAGRMEILRLLPLSMSEIHGKESRFLDRLFEHSFSTRPSERLAGELIESVLMGGFPSARMRRTPRRRRTWHRDYIDTLVQRDIRELARLRSADVLPRLLALAAGRTAQLLNVNELAGPFHVSRPTIREYVTLLEQTFLLEELPPWHINRSSRLIKTPKLHVLDTGLACALLGFDSASLTADRSMLGHLVETFVYQELRRQATGRDDDLRFFHYRDKEGGEVDIVIERSARSIVGVEVKAGATVHPTDLRGLRRLRDAAGKSFVAGAVLYDGEASVGFGEGLFAIPIRALWETR